MDYYNFSDKSFSSIQMFSGSEDFFALYNICLIIFEFLVKKAFTTVYMFF